MKWKTHGCPDMRCRLVSALYSRRINKCPVSDGNVKDQTGVAVAKHVYAYSLLILHMTSSRLSYTGVQCSQQLLGLHVI